MDLRLAWTDCDEAGDYVVPNVLSPRDLVSRPDNMDETVLHTKKTIEQIYRNRYLSICKLFVMTYSSVQNILFYN